MYSLRVETEFAAAHFLSHYHGKCEKLHGHNYRVRLWIKSVGLDEGGMAADFSLLKKALKEAVDLLDHTNMNDNDVFKNDPSAERIARFIFEQVTDRLPQLGINIKPSAVDVFETSTSMARYSEEPES
ncbi:MAG: 6-carboxytetrahydropterin synthase QueD [Treponema sp.]|nr:6-carboxytetrahydropterin synthase QueD [Treponema sp.]